MALDPAAVDIASSKPKDAVASLCAQIPHLPGGERAVLRRLFLTRTEAAVGVVAGLLAQAEVSDWEWRDAAAFARWQLLAHVAAVLSGTALLPPHRPGASFGRALQAASYADTRLMRLTSARGPALVDQIVRAGRMLAASGQTPVDLRTVHALSFDADDRAERARLLIARDYYAAVHAKTKDAS